MTATEPAFTLDVLDWNAWVPVVDPATATAEQTAVLQELPAASQASDYYRLLVHDPDALRERTRLFNTVMYAQGGLRRSDRELASVVVSRVNGCIYCASVHGRLYAQLTKTSEPIQRIFAEGVGAELSERERAIADYAVQLTLAPEKIAAADLQPLRAVGLNDLEILDLTHVVAMFAWANRLLQTLGKPVPKADA